MKSINSAPGNRGFTLVELMIVVAIMAVLASSAMPLYELTSQREKEKELRVALRQIREALDAYKRAVGEGRIARKRMNRNILASWRIWLSAFPMPRTPK